MTENESKILKMAGELVLSYVNADRKGLTDESWAYIATLKLMVDCDLIKGYDLDKQEVYITDIHF